MSETYQAIHAIQTEDGVCASLQSLTVDQLPDHEVLIQVHYSSLNYKDAMSATGQPGVTKAYPHTPGVYFTTAGVKYTSAQLA